MRLQILELPVVHHPDGTMTTPFILVASEVAPFGLDATTTIDAYRGLKDDSGAQCVFITSDVVEIGAPPLNTPDRSLTSAQMADLIRRY